MSRHPSRFTIGHTSSDFTPACGKNMCTYPDGLGEDGPGIRLKLHCVYARDHLGHCSWALNDGEEEPAIIACRPNGLRSGLRRVS